MAYGEIGIQDFRFQFHWISLIRCVSSVWLMKMDKFGHFFMCIYTNNWAGSVENEFLECSRALRLKSAIIWTFLCCFVMPICFVLFCLFNRVQGACLQQKWTLCIGFYGWSLPGSKLLFSAQPGRSNIIFVFFFLSRS